MVASNLGYLKVKKHCLRVLINLFCLNAQHRTVKPEITPNEWLIDNKNSLSTTNL
jgi:hypothetical protein